MTTMQSTRRNFLKIGSVIAAPLAAAAPGMAQAGDDAAERLARLEDINAIRDLAARYVMAVNAGRAEEARALFVDPDRPPADDTVRFIGADAGALSAIELSADRTGARLSAACTVRTETPITPSCPLVEMAKLQGEGVVRAESARMLTADFVKTDGAWKIAQATLAPA